MNTFRGRQVFKDKAPVYMKRLIADLALSDLDAAAIMGNAGHESGGLTIFQEVHPVAGRGGFGWFQWTGPRRRAFEAWCRRNKLDPKADDANYGFLVSELQGPESAAIAKIKRARDLLGKVTAFEASYERAGVKAIASRFRWAQLALAAYNAVGSKESV